MLYLEAEAAGARATGIGCFYDDPVHEVLGIADHALPEPVSLHGWHPGRRHAAHDGARLRMGIALTTYDREETAEIAEIAENKISLRA